MMRLDLVIFEILLVVASCEDRCSEVPCINLCCPEGDAFKEISWEKVHRCDDAPNPPKRCQAHPGEELSWAPQGWSGGREVEMKEGVDFILKAGHSQGLYSCPEGQMVSIRRFYPPHRTRVLRNSTLQVIYSNRHNETMVDEFPRAMFCLSFTSRYLLDLRSSFSPRTVQAELFICERSMEAEEEEQASFTGVFYPIAMFVSCFFIFLTLVVFVILPELRQNVFGKITVGFLFNVFVCYFFLGIKYSVHYFIGINYSLEHLNGLCVFLGYINQHTLISFFLWMSAMAINMTNKFSDIFKEERKDQRRALLKAVAYAQGLPVVISIVTATIDSYGSCSWILPNMGRYSCWLGSDPHTTSTFFSSPQFLYFYLIISVVIIANIICFLITGYFLLSHWTEVRSIRNSGTTDNLWTNVLVVFKIFLIMGLPWVLEVISFGVEFTYGSKHFHLRVLLDILNLLTGVITFTVLICKASVLKKLKELKKGREKNKRCGTSSTPETKQMMNLCND